MTPDTNASRTVGVLLLLHLAAGLIVPFILILPLVSARGFLASAATIPTQVRTAVMLLFVGSALPIGVACAGLRVFRMYSSAAAYWLLALAAASFALQAADNAHLLSMLSLSQAYAAAGSTTSTESIQTVAIALGALRKWSHYSFLLVIGCWMFLLYGFLYRFRLVPRVLAGFGLLGVLGQMGGVTLRGLWGYPAETRLAIPLAPAYAALAVWLIFKGFDERQQKIES
jgi:hypothetical protein